MPLLDSSPLQELSEWPDTLPELRSGIRNLNLDGPVFPRVQSKSMLVRFQTGSLTPRLGHQSDDFEQQEDTQEEVDESTEEALIQGLVNSEMDAEELKQKGVTEEDLRDIGATDEELKQMGFEVGSIEQLEGIK